MYGLSAMQLMHNATAMGGATPFAGKLGELSEGAMGSAVRELQSKLNVLQFGPLNVDGNFGESTKKALQAFQQSEGVGGNPPSGILDEETEARLNQRILSVSTGAGAQQNAQGQQVASVPARPWWQTALMVAGGIAIVGGIIYMFSSDDSKDGYKRALHPGRGEKEIPGRYNSRAERVAGLHRAKCDRSPGADAFEAGESMEVPS